MPWCDGEVFCLIVETGGALIGVTAGVYNKYSGQERQEFAIYDNSASVSNWERADWGQMRYCIF
jgi:hypothetical protein